MERNIKKVIIAKYIANLGTPVPSTNIFTTKQFEESTDPFKDVIRNVVRNTRGDIQW